MEKHTILNIIATILIIIYLILFIPALLILSWFALFIYIIPIILSIISIRIKRNTWGITLLIISSLKTILFVIMLGFLALLGLGSDKRKTPADAQMIEHFELNEMLFEELRSMIENDSLSHFPLFVQEKRDNILLPISLKKPFDIFRNFSKISLPHVAE